MKKDNDNDQYFYCWYSEKQAQLAGFVKYLINGKEVLCSSVRTENIPPKFDDVKLVAKGKGHFVSRVGNIWYGNYS